MTRTGEAARSGDGAAVARPSRDVERDQHTPVAWRTHLSERRQILADRIGQTGRELAADPPAWTRPLGPVPEQGTELRETWEHTAALADASSMRAVVS